VKKESIGINRIMALVVVFIIIITIGQIGLLFYEPLTNLIRTNEIQKTDSKISKDKNSSINKDNPYDFTNYKTIKFSGSKWYIKSSEKAIAPGNNYFSDDKENVWVDSKGYLHLKVTNNAGKWLCPEVINAESLGYGKYVFYVEGLLDNLDENIVFSMFIYEDDEHEIDIEYVKSKEDALNSQYVIQPYTKQGNLTRFDTKLNGALTTHEIDWKEKAINFQSRHGSTDYAISKWIYEGSNIPKKGNEHARINIYLKDGQIPLDNRQVEIVIRSFKFIP
jgi:hypothetical protein